MKTAGTPAKVIKRLGSELETILSLAEVKSLLVQAGAESALSTREVLSDRI